MIFFSFSVIELGSPAHLQTRSLGGHFEPNTPGTEMVMVGVTTLQSLLLREFRHHMLVCHKIYVKSYSKVVMSGKAELWAQHLAINTEV